jgi:hypothetical protein
MHVLFIMEKFHTNEATGPTNNIYNLLGSWECAGYGTYDVCYLDPTEVWSTAGVDNAILAKDYSAIIISRYHHLPSEHVAKQVGHKTFLFRWDSILEMSSVHYWSQYIHQACFDWGKGQEHPNCYCLEVPQDSRVFYPDPNVQKDIDISFTGSLNHSWNDRNVVIEKLRNAGFNVVAGGGRGPGHDNLPIEEYANMFRRSKICLNLSYGHGGKPQRKGRSFEIAASRAFMLTNCPQMFSGVGGTWFDENVHYASFDDNNLIDKVRYYLDHPEEREVIANNIYNHYMSWYAPNHFWSEILNICGAFQRR